MFKEIAEIIKMVKIFLKVVGKTCQKIFDQMTWRLWLETILKIIY